MGGLSFVSRCCWAVICIGLVRVVVECGNRQNVKKYSPNWPSIDSRPLPGWFDEAKLGIFIHWGMYSVPSYGDAWFWHNWWKGSDNSHGENVSDFMAKNYRPGFTYADFSPDFQAELFNATQWAEMFEASGAGYIVLTSKHHEGFTNWPSEHSFNWNAMDVGPARDPVGELADATRKTNKLKFGLYYSLFEWFHPLYLKDKQNGFWTQQYSKGKAIPELHDIVNTYKPEIVWSDGDWEAPDVYWNSTAFLAWLYNDSPVKDTVVTNDRWGAGIICHHGGYLTCHDNYNPGVLVHRKWENSMTIDKGGYAYKRESNLSSYHTMDELTQIFVETVSCGGNMLMDVGPSHDGRIVPIFEERLRQMGEWLQVNGEAIYSTRPWLYQNDTITKGIWYTSKKNSQTASTDVYALVLDWPADNHVRLGAPISTPDTEVVFLGFGNIPWTVMNAVTARGIIADLSGLRYNQVPCEWAWSFKLTNLKQQKKKL